MAFITKDDLKTEMGVDLVGDDSILSSLASTAMSAWDMLTDRTWASTSYSEFINGSGLSSFRLKNYPVTALTRIGIGRVGIMTITNTSEQSTATVEVLPTGLKLILDGGTANTDVDFATYQTISSVVSAVNLIGSGWSAETVSGYSSFKSSELLRMYPSSCIDSDKIYLEIPKRYLNNYRIDYETGCVDCSFSIGDSVGNITVDYTAGYTDALVPTWLKQVLIRQACFWYQQSRDRGWGVSSKSFGPDGGTISFTKLYDNFLPEFMMVASMNRSVVV